MEKISRIDGQGLLVGLPALVVLMFRQQIGAQILEDQRGLGIELERLAVQAVGLAIFLERGIDRGQIVQNLRIARIELERLFVAASGVFGVEHHLVVDAHLVPDRRPSSQALWSRRQWQPGSAGGR